MKLRIIGYLLALAIGCWFLVYGAYKFLETAPEWAVGVAILFVGLAIIQWHCEKISKLAKKGDM